MNSDRTYPGLLPFILLFLTALLASCDAAKETVPPPAPVVAGPAAYTGSDACAGCHESQYQGWAGSHHDLAMQHASQDTVLGNFNNATIQVAGVTSSFFTRDDKYWVETENEQGELAEFEIQYTFGITPLQQYLIEFNGGRLQTLPLAWDSRDETDGGQRWFHVYGEETIPHDDLLHWTGRAQNWNYMCAECHSTDLQKNFASDTQTFDTTWSEINVGCEGCHGPASHHVAAAKTGTLSGTKGLTVDLDDAGRSVWEMNVETGIASRSVLPTRAPQQPETCGRCHSRRSVMTEDYHFGQPLLATHRPALLDDGLYFPDGQIQDEVYVWGSFLQSKMYQAGVTCTDCHDPHTATLKADGEVSNVCSTCHLPSRFATTEHHQHQPQQVACVDCHMPSRDYMMIDGRRDHSFRLPRPDLTVSTGSPNACSNCHAEEGAQWAAARISDWYGDQRPAHYAEAIHAGRQTAAGANAMLAQAADNNQFPGIARATALSLLMAPLDTNSFAAILKGVNNPDALIRLGALRALQGAPAELRLQAALPALKDPLLVLRTEAFSLLSDLRAELPPAVQAAFNSAEKEYLAAQIAIAERPEAQINLASIYRDRGDFPQSELAFRRALAMEPQAVAARANLADLYRQLDRDDEGLKLLREGLALDANNGALHHTLGLALFRSNEPDAALQELERAATLEPDNRRYVYVHAVALNSLGHPNEAIAAMITASQNFPGDFDIGWGLATMLYAGGHYEQALSEGRRLQAQYPENRNLAEFLAGLTNR
jgi:tetratricopeptide (TPR) repeat protein